MSAVGARHSAEAEVRVMLVEDSAVVRGMVRNWLDNIDGIRVVDSAANGQVALDMVGAVRPDIIILDIEMPVMDGLTALPGILREVPDAKVLLASTLTRRNAEITLKALSLGASDYIAKPSFVREGNDARALFQEELVHKVSGLAQSIRCRVGNISAAPLADDRWAPIPKPGAVFDFRKPSPVIPRVLVIGASTGGPAALSQVIEDAGDLLARVPVLIAQHMPPTFTALLGDKLAALANLSGGEARADEPVVAGRLYVAPGGKHMRIKKRGADVVIALDEDPPINHCRPAVDPLFESVAEIYGNATLGVVLTGMGSDGARGAVSIADAGGTILAQDESSSVVWGMPGATAAAGASSALVSLQEMGARVGQCLSQGGRS